MSDLEKAIAIARGDTPEGRNWAYLSMKARDTVELGIRRLSSAGYHLLSEAELAERDNAVLERAAEVAERWTPFPKPTSRSALYWLTHCAKPNIAAAIRAMQGGKP